MNDWIGQKTVRKIAEKRESGYRLVEFRRTVARWGKRTVPVGVPVVFHYGQPDESQTQKED